MKLQEIQEHYSNGVRSTGWLRDLEDQKRNEQRARALESDTSPSLSRFTVAELEALLLRQARWEERQEALSLDANVLQDAPDSVGVFDENSNLVSTFESPLLPIAPDILDYLERCPKWEWDEFYNNSKDDETILLARQDVNVFCEYTFQDKDGKMWEQQPFHREWQSAIPTLEEAKRLACGETVYADFYDLQTGELFQKKLTTLIGAPREHSKCVTGDTLITLSDGRKVFARDLPFNKKFRVLSWDENNGYSCQNARLWRNTVQPIIQLRTKFGRVLRVSPEHPCWTVNGWVKAKDLQAGNHLAVARNYESKTEPCDLDSYKYRFSYVPSVKARTHVAESFCYDPNTLDNADLLWDEIVYVEEQPEELTYSIEVENTHVHITNDFITHNTTQMSVARVIWMLGNHPSLRCKIVTASDDLAKDIVFDIAQNIERNPHVSKVFPELRPDYNAGWTKSALYIERPVSAGKDASVEAKAVLGTGAGGRADLLIFDDVIDQRNAVANPKLRQQVADTIRNVWIPLMPTDGICWYSATPWHNADFTHEIKSDPNWAHWWKPAYTDEYIFDDDGKLIETKRTSLWPSKWSETTLGIRKGIIGERAFTQQFLLVALSDDEATFKESELSASFDYSQTNLLGRVPKGWYSFAGVDLASSLKKKAAFTVIFTIAVDPNTGRRHPVEIFRSKISFPDTIAELIRQWRKHSWNLLYVENNGYQQAVVSGLAASEDPFARGIPVRGFHTGSQKVDSEVGLPGFAVVLGHAGWCIPMGTPGVPGIEPHAVGCSCNKCVWIAEMRLHPLAQYSDTVMASWFAERAAVSGGSKFQEVYAVHTNQSLEIQNTPVATTSTQIIEGLQRQQDAKDARLLKASRFDLLELENMLWKGQK